MKCMKKEHITNLVVYAGGGITERNLQRILEGSGAQEFHCSARSSKDSAMKFRYDFYYTDKLKFALHLTMSSHVLFLLPRQEPQCEYGCLPHSA